jgi:hypothetical protein
MQLKLVAEKQDCSVVQLQEAIPFVDPGSPERSRKGDAQHELGERRLGDQFNNRIRPLNEPPDRLPYPRHSISFLHKGPS